MTLRRSPSSSKRENAGLRLAYLANFFGGAVVKILTTIFTVLLLYLIDASSVDTTPARVEGHGLVGVEYILYEILITIIAAPLIETVLIAGVSALLLKVKYGLYLAMVTNGVISFFIHGGSPVDIEAAIAFALFTLVWWWGAARYGYWHAFGLCTIAHAGANTTATIAYFT